MHLVFLTRPNYSRNKDHWISRNYQILLETTQFLGECIHRFEIVFIIQQMFVSGVSCGKKNRADKGLPFCNQKHDYFQFLPGLCSQKLVHKIVCLKSFIEKTKQQNLGFNSPNPHLNRLSSQWDFTLKSMSWQRTSLVISCVKSMEVIQFDNWNVDLKCF